MENRAHALAAGLFALMLGAATIFAIWWFAGDREEQTIYELVSTTSISGLNPQAQVRFRGIAAGRVTDIRIDPEDQRNILVTISIDSEIPVTRGTRATLGYQGLTGLSYVQLEDRNTDTRPLTTVDGTPPRLPLDPGLFDKLSDTALEVVERFNTISDQIAAFFDEDNLNRFRSTLETLESAAGGIDRTFVEAPRTLEAIGSIFSAENVRSLTSMIANLERLSADAAPVAQDARALVQRLSEVLETIDNVALAAGDSVLDNTLPRLNALLKELTDTSARMGRLIEEVEATPQMLITGRSERRAGPGETGFEPNRR